MDLFSNLLPIIIRLFSYNTFTLRRCYTVVVCAEEVWRGGYRENREELMRMNEGSGGVLERDDSGDLVGPCLSTGES